MSQSTTDGNGETDEPTQSYVDCTQLSQPYEEKVASLSDWPHEHQPDWSQYAEKSQDSDASRALCSLGVPLTQDSSPKAASHSGQQSRILVPETPESSQTKPVAGRARPVLSRKEVEEQIARITEYLKQSGYTVFAHKTTHGNVEKTMHLAFLMYDHETNVSGETKDKH